jgi:hypothetical protein
VRSFCAVGIHCLFIVHLSHQTCFVIANTVDKRMLVYSFREKSWVWDMNEICEENIMPNVVELLSEKLGNLSEDSQVSK